jgi:hypothetical protein
MVNGDHERRKMRMNSGKIGSLTTLLLCALGGLASDANALEPEAIFQRVWPAVWTVKAPTVARARSPSAVRSPLRPLQWSPRAMWSTRAFLITGDGRYGTATSSAALIGHVKACAGRNVTCAVYAVDNTVVWGMQQAAAK